MSTRTYPFNFIPSESLIVSAQQGRPGATGADGVALPHALTSHIDIDTAAGMTVNGLPLISTGSTWSTLPAIPVALSARYITAAYTTADGKTNTAVGQIVGSGHLGTSNNVGIGYLAGDGTGSNTGGSSNTAIGSKASPLERGGSKQIHIGTSAGSEGSKTIAIGTSVGSTATTASEYIAIGTSAIVSSKTVVIGKTGPCLEYSVVIGDGANATATATGGVPRKPTVVIGNDANSTGFYNSGELCIGYRARYRTIDTFPAQVASGPLNDSNIAIGAWSLNATNARFTVAIGARVLSPMTASGLRSHTITNVTAIGQDAARGPQSSSWPAVAIGTRAGKGIDQFSSVIGYNSCSAAARMPMFTTAIGSKTAAIRNTSGSVTGASVAVGYGTTVTENCIAIGAKTTAMRLNGETAIALNGTGEDRTALRTDAAHTSSLNVWPVRERVASATMSSISALVPTGTGILIYHPESGAIEYL